MDFAYDEATVELQQRRLAFMDECVYPSERAFAKRRSHSMTGGKPHRSSRS
jgi:acyl-CoA dehydrogenase